MHLRVPFWVLLICPLASCAAPPERVMPEAPAPTAHKEIDRMFDALIRAALATETPGQEPQLMPDQEPEMTPGMLLDQQGTAIQAREMQRLPEALAPSHPFDPPRR